LTIHLTELRLSNVRKILLLVESNTWAEKYWKKVEQYLEMILKVQQININKEDNNETHGYRKSSFRKS